MFNTSTQTLALHPFTEKVAEICSKAEKIAGCIEQFIFK